MWSGDHCAFVRGCRADSHVWKVSQADREEGHLAEGGEGQAGAQCEAEVWGWVSGTGRSRAVGPSSGR